MSDAPAERTSDDPVRAAGAAKERAAQLRALDALIAQTYPGPQSMTAFQSLLGGAAGSRVALEFVARMPDPVPKGVMLLAAQQLPDRANPLPLRLAVAGKLLASLPDTVQAVGPIVRSITAGLSRSRTLERMLQLQSRVDRSATLDEMVRTSEARVKLKCPKCRAKLTRPEFIVHLWSKHRMIFERGQALEPAGVVEAIVERAASGRSAALPEEAFRATANFFPDSAPLQVLQAVAARQRSTASVPLPLADAAGDADHSLCPVCLAPQPDPIRPLPPPLALGSNRIAGDGFAVRVRETASSQIVEVQTPDSARTIPAGTHRRFGPRGLAVLIALPFFAAFLVADWIVPFRIAPPFGVAVFLALLGWGLYAAVRATRPVPPTAAVLSVDIAWREIAENLAPTDATVRFLTRLGLASFGKGTCAERAGTLRHLIDATSARADGNPAFVQLLAAALALQVADGADLGKDRVNGLARLFEGVWQGERSVESAEYLAEIASNRMVLGSGEARRLALLLMASAFDSGLLPQDLLALFPYLPWLRMAMGMPTPLRLQVACAVWRGKNSEPWSNAGPAVTLFELAKKAPAASRKILVSCPDALLKLMLPEAVQRTLGDVLLTPRGLMIGSALLTDPDIIMDLGRSPRGSGWVLKLGREIIALDRKLPGEMIPVFAAWLRYRVDKLIPLAETLTRSNPVRVRVLLGPLVSACALCGAESIGRTGKVADPWPLERST